MSITYPPHFSSTETYANRYDLDEINVFIEGDLSNPMYFSINGIDKQFPYGKHYFNITILDSSQQEHQLRAGSRILFEFKSINNVVLRSDIATVDQKNGVVTGFVEVLRDPLRTTLDIQDGQGTLTLVGSLENKSITENLIPNEFLGAMNYRCTFPFEIRKNLIGANSPINTNVEHKQNTFAGAFSFVENNVSPTTDDGASFDGSSGQINSNSPAPQDFEITD
tara:strand:+ start:37 stop:705 length:669 start_codon:yes stop_codon:yes gene_type:complete